MYFVLVSDVNQLRSVELRRFPIPSMQVHRDRLHEFMLNREMNFSGVVCPHGLD